MLLPKKFWEFLLCSFASISNPHAAKHFSGDYLFYSEIVSILVLIPLVCYLTDLCWEYG